MELCGTAGIPQLLVPRLGVGRCWLVRVGGGLVPGGVLGGGGCGWWPGDVGWRRKLSATPTVIHLHVFRRRGGHGFLRHEGPVWLATMVAAAGGGLLVSGRFVASPATGGGGGGGGGRGGAGAGGAGVPAETGFWRALVDISERKRTERLKDEFVSTVSHELRTPLTSITGSLGLLMGNAAGKLPEPAARLLAIAHANSQRLGRLINDILDMEKIESGQVIFNLKRLDVQSLVEQTIEANRGFAQGFGVRLRLDDALAAAGTVHADPDRLAQVVTNLLSNAIKFSPAGEEVVVAVAKRSKTIRISVRDHGHGIPAEFKPRIFEKFAQADATDARQKGVPASA